MSSYILAIDQGTTSSRAMLFNRLGEVVAQAQEDYPQSFPADGWVEQDARDWWRTVLACCKAVLASAGAEASEVAAIGITNQRETTVLWDRATGEPIAPAIVWQDRRTAAQCAALREAGVEPEVEARTGLRLDPYFSATKIAWLLAHVPEARARAEAGELAFGTVDSFLLWQLSGGMVHATDASNASRTLLFNIHEQCWDATLLKLFDIPAVLLPEVKDCASHFGHTATSLFGAAIPLAGVAGDQQAALMGQACFRPGQAKITLGTGAFLMINTGWECVASSAGLLGTVAYRLQGTPTYALEGSIFNAGTTVKWLRDKLRIIHSAAETEALARERGGSRGVYFVPAFTGLGAPYWDPEARGAITGLNRDSDLDDVVVAALEAVAFQTRDLLEAVRADGGEVDLLRVDGGMAVNDWLLKRMADITGVPVARPRMTESTVLGAAALAALQAGWYASLEQLAQAWQCEREFLPGMAEPEREALYAGWRAAVGRTLNPGG